MQNWTNGICQRALGTGLKQKVIFFFKIPFSLRLMTRRAVYPGNKLRALSETKKKSYCILIIEKDGNTAGVCPNPAARV